MVCVYLGARVCVCVCMAGDRLLNANLFYTVSFLRGTVSFFVERLALLVNSDLLELSYRFQTLHGDFCSI